MSKKPKEVLYEEFPVELSSKEYVNRFVMRGTVTKKSVKVGSVLITLSIKHPYLKILNCPKIFIFDKEMMKRADKEISLFSFVTFSGHIQTNKSTPGLINLVATDFIVHSGSNKGRRRDVNDIFIRGKIMFPPYSKDENTTTVNINTFSESGNIAFFNVVTFGELASKIKKYKQGDFIDLVCKIKTRLPSEDSKGYQYQSIFGRREFGNPFENNESTE